MLLSAVELAAAGAALAGAGTAFVVSRAYYRARLREMHQHAERTAKALAQANEYLRQARQQADTFRKELVLARRPAPRPAPVPAEPAAPSFDEALSSLLDAPPARHAPSMPAPRVDAPLLLPSTAAREETVPPRLPPSGFADTMPFVS